VPVAEGVKVEVHRELEASTATKLQGLPAKPPAPLLVKVTLPPGALLVPASVSRTVAVQVAGLFTGSVEGLQLTEVEVVRLFTVIMKAPLPKR
jgi:hypothetical protein